MTAENPPELILGVLASGRGSNFCAIDDAISDGRLNNTQIGVVLSDNPDAGALDIARERGIPAFYLGDVDNEQRNEAIVEKFEGHGVNMGIGAGYMRQVGRNVLKACSFDVLNIHPAPLPRFGGKGMHGLLVHQAVLDSGVKWSGPTVHVMDEVYDHGQILAHTQVPVLKDDIASSLADRILPYEHALFWRVIARQHQRGAYPG